MPEMGKPTLLPWQAGLWAAGCIERLAPYLRARGTPREIAFCDSALGALWAGHGELTTADAERIAAVGTMLHDRRKEDFVAEALILSLPVMAAVATLGQMPACCPPLRKDGDQGPKWPRLTSRTGLATSWTCHARGPQP